MNELSKDEPNLDNLDKNISQTFRYQEYIDSIKDLPNTVQDPVSEASDAEEPEKDEADETSQAKDVDAVEIEEVETEKKEGDDEKKEVVNDDN